MQLLQFFMLQLLISYICNMLNLYHNVLMCSYPRTKLVHEFNRKTDAVLKFSSRKENVGVIIVRFDKKTKHAKWEML